MYISKTMRRAVIGVAALVSGFFALNAAIAAEAVPPGKALVYVIQGETGNFYNLVMRVDGASIGRVKTNSYVTFVADPGTHQLSTATSGIGSIPLKVEAGKVYYVASRVNAQGAPEFRSVSEAEAQPLLLKAGMKRNDLPAPASATARAGTPSAPPAQKTAPATAAPAAAKPAKRPAKQSSPSVSPREGMAVFIKGGSFKLSNGTQQWFGVDSIIETKSSGYFGGGLEYQFANGFAVGGEYFRYENKWAQTSGGAGSFTTSVFMLNGKKYFAMGEMFYPYLGAGVGSVKTSFSGDITGGTYNTAFQLLAGFEVTFQRVGVYVELSSVSAKTTATNGEKIDASGKATSVGLRFHF